MRAAGIAAPSGAVELLQLDSPRRLGAGEVLIQVEAAGVGNWDDIMRTGGWPSGLPTPHALGVEAAGVITDVADDVARSHVGTQVLTHLYPFRDNGAWAEQLVAPFVVVAPKPAALPWPVAAAIAVPALTAMQAVEPLNLGAGSQVFVHGAGGLTGGLIAELAVTEQADVVVTAGPHSADRLRAAGVRLVVDRTRPDWAKQVEDAFGGPVHAVVNATPGGSADVVPLVAPGGQLSLITGVAPAADRITVHEIVVAADGARLAEAVARFESGTLTIPPIQSFDLADAHDALARAVSGAHGAAIALTI
jgi:NADPH:quinone reductase-like Zn-dependent oxidoreductase